MHMNHKVELKKGLTLISNNTDCNQCVLTCWFTEASFVFNKISFHAIFPNANNTEKLCGYFS